MVLCDCAWNMLLRNVVETWTESAAAAPAHSPPQVSEQLKRPRGGAGDGDAPSGGLCWRQRRVCQLLVLGSVVVSVRRIASDESRGKSGRGGGAGADDAVARAAFGRLAACAHSLQLEQTGGTAPSTTAEREEPPLSLFDGYGTSAPRALPCGTTYQNVWMRW